MRDWILLIHQLPPRPTNLRVRTWRKLQKLGAVAIKNSVYVLPFNDKTYEDFQWLKQEIESAAGEAAVFRASTVEGATDGEIITLFHNARNEEYALLSAEFDGLTGAIREQKKGEHLSAGRISGYEAELDKLHKELDRIIATDFFEAPGRPGAVEAYERCRKVLRTSQSRKEQLTRSKIPNSHALSLSQYQGRRWVTRRNLFIDRLASIWLIKRFIDKRPRFYFVPEGERIDGAIGFDMYEAEFTHRGEDCTFETMIKEFGLGDDAGIESLSEIVHDIDLKDNKFNRLEAAGLSTIVRGLADLLNDDRKLIQQTGPIFDGLYELLSREEKTSGEKGDGKRTGGSGKKRGKQS